MLTNCATYTQFGHMLADIDERENAHAYSFGVAQSILVNVSRNSCEANHFAGIVTFLRFT